MNMFTIIFWIVIGIICAVIHKNKGYSPIAGFCWGFFLSVIGLIVVLLEKTKEEHDMAMSTGKHLTLFQWLAIFIGIGVGFIVFFFIITGMLH
ncbi:MAG: hypothetical protein IKF52_02330 [Clostridia bacterium]|nr:hypothetical protein [Clostridia bacterium]